MRLSNLDYGVVLQIVENAHDIEQIYTLHGHRDPAVIANSVMAAANFSWVAWADGAPVTVFGAREIYDGVWHTYLLTTADFRKIALPLTKFAKRTVVPTLFEKIGAHRLEAFLHEDNVFIHRWVEALGARREFVKENFSRDGKAYFGYAICKGTIDPQNQTG
ncbi:hypothetical protein [Bradyrhizobium neotropicale]|uniref:hypothetical protein n=1 Tax=Bradyrhizobium neotropicale TaxID=1497615 RepID=UPI001AD7B72E|nr:hypothetical protein [Bradyrhizobium neotropicale]